MMRVLGGMAVVASVLLGLALWLVAKDSTDQKIAVEIAFLFVAGIIVLGATVVASCTVAKVQDGSLNFFFCGMRTRSFALDGATVFDMHRIGRLEILRIWRLNTLPVGAPDRETFAAFVRQPIKYVPNGALDKNELVDLLRANGVAERQAD